MKLVKENLNDILKPKDPEDIKKAQQYRIDVLQDMLNKTEDLMKDVQGVIDTNTDLLNDVQMMWMKSQQKVLDNYYAGISVEDTANEILGI
jgi:hypothetical protein